MSNTNCINIKTNEKNCPCTSLDCDRAISHMNWQDGKFVWAESRIDSAVNSGLAEDTVLVESSQVSSPVAVRYAWDDNPACNLYNRAGLLASPFRTNPD